MTICACCRLPIEPDQMVLTRDDGDGPRRIHFGCLGRDLEQSFPVQQAQEAAP
jgi:hypothetical protein